MDGAAGLTSEIGAPSTLRAASIRRLDELDWDFTDQASHSAFSDIHWHPCRFPSQVPAIAIGRLTRPGDWVLDPFLGSGTTLVEAQRLGRPSTGIDVNPIAALMAGAKTMRLPADEVARFVSRINVELNATWDDLVAESPPSSVQMDKWYTPKTQDDLLRLWGFVNREGVDLGPILRATFSAILMPACRETRHWGYICDNSMPKSQRERNVRQLFGQTLLRFADAYGERDAGAKGSVVEANVILGDARLAMQSLPDERYACVVTSPPYAGVADYVKSQRLSMEWFGFNIPTARNQEIGARSKRHRATSTEDYISGLERVYAEMFRVLSRGGWAVVVYGQSPARSSAKAELDDALLRAGFVVELEKVRQISEGRRQYPSLREEFVIVLRKP